LVRADLRPWRESSWALPLAGFVATFCLWMAALAVGLWSPHWPVRAALVVPLTLLSGQLFTLGHDAGHGSFSTSRTVNSVVGRLALLPSLHVLGLWRFHHDVHHRHTNLRRHDFVWTPLTVAEYRALPGWRRRLHHVYRHPSGVGLGLHYAIEIWAPRMLWPWRRHDVPKRACISADVLLLYGVVIGLAIAGWWFVAVVAPDRVGDVGSWASAIGLLIVLPLIGTQWLIGFVIYLNPTHPDIAWYDDPAEWSLHQVQLEGSAGQRCAGPRQALLPRRILNHTAHHVDPGVPLRSLDGAQRHLVANSGDRVVSWNWSRSRFRDVVTRCKLYDYESQRWLTYAAIDDQP
jgi:omega-6 fatty acid desaturase (delta-12 desaturase)